MRVFLLIALAAALAAGCSKSDDSTGTTGTTGATPKGTTGSTAATPGPAPAGKYVAVQTLFTTNCVKCHGDANPKAGITLTNYDGVMKGGREGAVVAAGDPAGSKLVKALHGQGAKQMPPGGPLPAADVATIEAWIKDGAKNG
ncbi:MAG TPA: c-type cytochrome domain-containing protein [Fimbriimonadaceae bacterium]|nr:c-type cytochrome domain-containing protein [Fimbriimonadaceae bacterium]